MTRDETLPLIHVEALQTKWMTRKTIMIALSIRVSQIQFVEITLNQK